MTLHDVAQRAGVALGTARKALGGDPTVRSYIRERVRQAARDLDYQPNLVAQALKQKTLPLVPISVRNLEQIFFGSLAGHLSRLLVEMGMEPALCFDPEHLLRMSRSLSTRASIVSAEFDENVIRALAQRQKVVAIIARMPRLYNVGTVEVDFPSVYRHAVDVLLATGRRRIAFCSSFYVRATAHGWHEPKGHTILARLREADMALAGPLPQPVFASPAEFGAWLDERPGAVDALFCGNDMEAAHAVGVLAARGRRTPDDVLVIGCDNNFVLPGMWTVTLDTAVLAKEAIGLLRRLLGGETQVEPRLYVPRLVNDRGAVIEMPSAGERRPVSDREERS